jgi:hypothetical protein
MADDKKDINELSLTDFRVEEFVLPAREISDSSLEGAIRGISLVMSQQFLGAIISLTFLDSLNILDAILLPASIFAIPASVVDFAFVGQDLENYYNEIDNLLFQAFQQDPNIPENVKQDLEKEHYILYHTVNNSKTESKYMYWLMFLIGNLVSCFNALSQKTKIISIILALLYTKHYISSKKEVITQKNNFNQKLYEMMDETGQKEIGYKIKELSKKTY